jgi:hypothetical protein
MISLTTSYKEYLEAKKLGAKWNGAYWYVPKNKDYRLFKKWLPQEMLDELTKGSRFILTVYIRKAFEEMVSNGSEDEVIMGMEEIDSYDWERLETLLEKATVQYKVISQLGHDKTAEKIPMRGVRIYDQMLSSTVHSSGGAYFESEHLLELFLLDNLHFAMFDFNSSRKETLVGEKLIEGEICTQETAERIQLKNEFAHFTEYETYIFDALIEFLEGKTTVYNYP